MLRHLGGRLDLKVTDSAGERTVVSSASRGPDVAGRLHEVGIRCLSGYNGGFVKISIGSHHDTKTAAVLIATRLVGVGCSGWLGLQALHDRNSLMIEALLGMS